MPILNCVISNLKENWKHENEIKIEKNIGKVIFKEIFISVCWRKIGVYGILLSEISDSLFFLTIISLIAIIFVFPFSTQKAFTTTLNKYYFS